ncbi:MAG: metallophosphoesterase [Clostridioides sp.]|jgi:predicted phosphohydrolase|nr:metallophosphoesterase [Clostridioides sp.]
MSFYVIGDLHFSNGIDKPMDIFGDNWKNHQRKIIKNWKETVSDEDTVVLLGDTSWAMNLKEAKQDLELIDSLPGKKILIKGNHDYWWSTVKKMNQIYESMFFLHNNFYSYDDFAICGSRGWICPNDTKFDENDEKAYLREINRMKTSINLAKKAGFEKIIMCIHYPPTNDKLENSEFTTLFEQENIAKVYYGHLHGEEYYKMGLKGIRNGIEYTLASSDYMDFKLRKIL